MVMRRGRFAPTPSGQLHLGNVLSALLAWLQMRSQNGAFILRMEDLDRSRSRETIARQIAADLKWLGLDWDEGPDIGGPFGPYVQSKRIERYEEAISQLQSQHRLYPCFCSRAKLLEIARAPHGLAAEGPVYPGFCKHLTESEQIRKADEKKPSLRFAVNDQPVYFEDLVLGNQRFAPFAGGDFIVKRADNIHSYQLAVVVDDAAMGITDVLRGNDLLDSTPRQLMLYEALKLTPPRFGHLPLLYGPDGKRLSKRHHSIAIHELRAAGVAPEKIIGYLAFWGGQIDRPEPAAPCELIDVFDTRKIPVQNVILGKETLHQLIV